MKLGLCRCLWVGLMVALSCSGDEGQDDGPGPPCTPGQQLPCACADTEGVQTCVMDGSGFGPCTCGDTTGGATQGPTETAASSGDGTTGAMCGDGVEDPGECSTEDPAYCPDDCESDDGTTGPGDCTDQGPIYVTLVPSVASRWESGALVGFAAGQQMCRETAGAMGLPGAGELTVCNYVQLLQAELMAELGAVPAGTTAWVHRTTVADVMGMPSEPGIGGRCAEWSSVANDVADGEYVEFPGGGVLVPFLDDDTFYDGVDTTHTQVGLLECGMQLRSILCCNPTCVP